jgi:hypothetical protein
MFKFEIPTFKFEILTFPTYGGKGLIVCLTGGELYLWAEIGFLIAGRFQPHPSLYRCGVLLPPDDDRRSLRIWLKPHCFLLSIYRKRLKRVSSLSYVRSYET